MLQRQFRRHVATTGARRTVDAESTPTEHRERKEKAKTDTRNITRYKGRQT